MRNPSYGVFLKDMLPNTDEFSNRKRAKDILSPSATEVIYEQLPFDHPIYILYSYVQALP